MIASRSQPIDPALVFSVGADKTSHLLEVRAGCEKVGTGFSLKSRSKFLESITFHDFGSTRPKIMRDLEHFPLQLSREMALGL